MECSSEQLIGKTALITGCNRGIGKVAMRLFAQNGANIIACARKADLKFEKELNLLSQAYNITIFPLYFDLSNEEEIKIAMKAIYAKKIPIDILLNNAGVATGNLLHMTSLKTVREVFEINFFSQVLITQYISKLMVKQNGGSIINMGSVAGMDGFPGYTAYGSSKAALIFFTKTIAKELAKNNIRVNAIAPGLTETEMATGMEQKAKNEMLTQSAFNRLAKPEEIAQLALFLASDKSSFITGQTIRIDGGM
jgi:3-oxoacyl-[acyl-carrier protein] reductase